MSLPRHIEYLPLSFRYPGFTVVDGAVRHYFGGFDLMLLLGQSVSYKKHGTFKVLYAHTDWGVLQVTLPWGSTHRVFIPPRQFLTVVRGQRYTSPHWNYEYFRSAIREQYPDLFKKAAQGGYKMTQKKEQGTTLSPNEVRQVNQIAHRITRWARDIGDTRLMRNCGYCMTGRWDGFYQMFLFPNKVLRDDRLVALTKKLRDLGYYASLAVNPFEEGSGLYMYMSMHRAV